MKLFICRIRVSNFKWIFLFFNFEFLIWKRKNLRVVFDHEINQHMYCVMLLRFLKKAFVISMFLLLVNTCYLYECWDSNGWCKFIDVSIYKTTEGDSVAVSQTKNGHIQLYLGIMKVKKKLFYMTWLTVDRLTRARLMSLWNVRSWF